MGVFVFACVSLGWFALSVLVSVIMVACVCLLCVLCWVCCFCCVCLGLVCVKCAYDSLYNNVFALRWFKLVWVLGYGCVCLCVC